MVSVDDWPVEDDERLCGAMEEGAGLEALAAGLVPLSRAYALPELEARWRALLYDSKVAAPAAARLAVACTAAVSTAEGAPFASADVHRRLPVQLLCAGAPPPGTADTEAGATGAVATAGAKAKGSEDEGAEGAAGGSTGGGGDGDDGDGSPSPANFSDAEQSIVQAEVAAAAGGGVGTAAGGSARRLKLPRCVLETMAVLERTSCAANSRQMTRVGALAALRGAHTCFLISKPNVLVGRSTEEKKVDVDLALEGSASKVSREQARIKMRQGVFKLVNMGRRAILVNNCLVESGHQRRLERNCLIEVGGLRFLFQVNSHNVRKYMKSRAAAAAAAGGSLGAAPPTAW